MTAAEFDQRLRNSTLALSLVGMSNAGKSYWAKRLAKEADFEDICCDDLIEDKLRDRRGVTESRGIAGVAEWLGQPYEERFVANQQTYLALEKETLETAIGRVSSNQPRKNIVIDTTGSVVHLPTDIRMALIGSTMTVYLKAGEDELEEMFKLYLAQPKPVIWGTMYRQEPGEDQRTVMSRCYPELLAYRDNLYSDLAEVTIPRKATASIRTADQFLELIKQSLPDR